MSSKPPFQDQLHRFSLNEPSEAVKKASRQRQDQRTRARLKLESEGHVFIDGRRKKKTDNVQITNTMVPESRSPEQLLVQLPLEEDLPTDYLFTPDDQLLSDSQVPPDDQLLSDSRVPPDEELPSNEELLSDFRLPPDEELPPKLLPTPQELETFLEIFLGVTPYIYYFSRRPEYLEAIQHIQQSTLAPLDAKSKEFQELETIWIHEPGVHIGVDAKQMCIVFAVRITPYENMIDHDCEHLRKCFKLMMDWTYAVSSIKNNGSHTANRLNPSQHSDITNTRRGSMFALGWHASMESGKKLVWYAPGSSAEALEEYSQLTEKMASEIAELYRRGLETLYPAGFKRLAEVAEEEKILGFQQFHASSLALSIFANSLVVTRDDFSNFQHCDRDAVEVAYGMWWAGSYDEDSRRYILSDKCDHDMISGGSFLFGNYGYGVQFEKCKGIVEVSWRGSLDSHSTMQSQSRNGATRFGTSVQITRTNLQAVRNWREGGSKVSQTVGHQDRIAKRKQHK